MDTVNIKTIDGRVISVGEKQNIITENKLETILFSDDGKVALVELPIRSIKAIELAGVEYDNIIDMAAALDLSNIEKLICCGEGECMEWTDIKNVPVDTCPIGCSNRYECEEACYTVRVYREEGTIGYDLAQPMYAHGLECIVVALPGFAYKRN